MRLESVDDAVVEVRVSVRNLMSLLSKTIRTGSARTLEKAEPGAPTLRIVGESDAEHYGHRGYPPGPVVSEDEPGVEWGVELPGGRVQAHGDFEAASGAAGRTGRPIVSRVATPWRPADVEATA